jgi:hypothetical protein
MSFSKHALLVLLVLVAAVPATAQSQLQLQQQMKGGAGEGKPPLPLHANVSLTHSVGSGTFVASPFNPTVSSNLTLNPLIAWQGFTFLVNQTFGFEYTQSDLNAAANQIEMSDTILLARYGRLALPDWNLMVIPTVGYQLPLSLASRQSGSLGTPTAALRGIWSLPEQGLSFYLQASTGYSLLIPALANRFLQEETRPLNDRVIGPITPVTCNPRNAGELLSYGCHEGLLPSVWRWNSATGVSWNGLDGALSVNLDLAYSQAFSVFTGPNDALKADNAVSGLVPRQFSSGNLSATWIPAGWVFLTLGVNSFQPALAADGKGLRFPIWDFVSPYNNFSQIYFDTTFSI